MKTFPLILSYCRCDVCVSGPPEMQNLKAEADILLQVIAAHYVSTIDISFVFLLMFFVCILGHANAKPFKS